MAVKDCDTWQPQWVALPILDLVRLVHQFGDDTESLGQWVKRFSDDLLFCNTDSEDELTRRLLEDAKEKVQKLSTAGKKGGKASAKARKQKQKSQEVAGNGNAPDESVTVSNPLALDMSEPYKDKATAKTRDNSSSCRYASPSCSPEDGTNAARSRANSGPANDQSDRYKCGREEPATDADIRKDSENEPDAGNGGMLESGTSAAGDSFEVREMASPGEGRKTLSAGSSSPAGNTPPQFVINHNLRHRPQKPQANSPPRSSEDVRLFALDRNLDIDDARMWYQMNFVDRPGCDKDGVAINNWKGHCTAYCKAEAERRKAG